jgi:Ca2+/Na+ antiporter
MKDNMILFLSLLVIFLLSFFILINKQSPSIDYVAILLIVYAFTIFGFLWSDMSKRKLSAEKNVTFSSYHAYSKKTANFIEFPKMKYYAFSGTVHDDSLPTFLLKNNLIPDITVDSGRPFMPDGYPNFSNDYMVLKVLNTLIWSSYSFHKIEAHASTFGATTYVGIASEINKIIKSKERISFDMLSSLLKDNKLFQLMTKNQRAIDWAKNNWKTGIAMPADARCEIHIKQYNKNHTLISLSIIGNYFKFFTFRNNLTINIITDESGGIRIGTWIMDYQDPEQFGLPLDYLVVEPELSVKTNFNRFTIWNDRSILYQKWLNYLADSLNEKLNFEEDFKYLPDKMIKDILRKTRYIQKELQRDIKESK